MGFPTPDVPNIEIPPWIYVTLSGYSVGDLWIEEDPLPHNGTFQVFQYDPGNPLAWIYRLKDYETDLFINYYLYYNGFVSWEIRTITKGYYYSGVYLQYPWNFANDSRNLTPIGTAYYGGGIVVWWPSDISPWGVNQVARLFNISRGETVKFEPLWQPGHKMMYRFADTRDKSCTKIIIDKWTWPDDPGDPD